MSRPHRSWNLFACLMLVLAVSACGGGGPTPAEAGDQGGHGTDPGGTDGTVGAHTFAWSTSGGGDLEFSATWISSEEVHIQVTRYDFQTLSRTLDLTRGSGQAFTTAMALLAGTLVPGSSPPVGVGGSWTTITLPSGAIEHVVLSPELRALSDFVTQALGGGTVAYPG